jgi:hypothetical protein
LGNILAENRWYTIITIAPYYGMIDSRV